LPKGEVSAIWSSAATQDVDDLWDYYAVNASLEIADRIVEEVEAAARRVALHPFHGRLRDEIVPGLRSVRSPAYIVFYRLVPGGIEIVRVLHERRDLDAALQELS
jgi:toxin ParE1/3/4